MSTEAQSENPEVRQALNDLRNRTVASLRTFNNSVPYASWLRRSEIEQLTVDLSRATMRAPNKRQSSAYRKIKKAYSWIDRVRTTMRSS